MGLLVCVTPGDELTRYAGTILRQGAEDWAAVLIDPQPCAGESLEDAEATWRAACDDLGIDPIASLRCPVALLRYGAAPRLSERLEPLVRSRGDLYIPDPSDSPAGLRWVALAAARCSSTVVCPRRAGSGDSVAWATAEEHQRLLSIVNNHYRLRMRDGGPSVQDVGAASVLVRLSRNDVERFVVQWLGWRTSIIQDDAPWDLETSMYESDRHEVELRVLSSLEWRSVAEIGACSGAFTALLAKRWPDRKIVAFEPNASFFRRLAARLPASVETRHRAVEGVVGLFDIVFVSSVLYYLDAFPWGLLEHARRYFVSSHKRDYHHQVVRPAMTYAGWQPALTKELLPMAESFAGFPVRKDGTEVVVFERTGAD